MRRYRHDGPQEGRKSERWNQRSESSRQRLQERCPSKINIKKDFPRKREGPEAAGVDRGEKRVGEELSGLEAH